ncbi:hypothetical protein BD410DRAFT_757306 [Rickenella mellea]|uniref:Uncharacterized protein n=1 Tax=Rickenella mellea TaxID=50990 RepID=A0A4Y7PFQ0_9AGAM|nr:hypothetical protein BD410DRAFT_757306 [Rickenella mellea]
MWDPDCRAPLPERSEDGTLVFSSEPHFTPNMTPEEMIRSGSFGGTAFRRHHSSLLNCDQPETDYSEFPATWYDDLDVSTYLTSQVYRSKTNRYGVKAGQSLMEWERAGWINVQDPRGWFQWYCRFYLGRRTPDDERQIRRWLGVCGTSGRFKRSLVNKIASAGAAWDDESISPIIRQTLQHWGYRLTEADYNEYL